MKAAVVNEISIVSSGSPASSARIYEPWGRYPRRRAGGARTRYRALGPTAAMPWGERYRYRQRGPSHFEAGIFAIKIFDQQERGRCELPHTAVSYP